MFSSRLSSSVSHRFVARGEFTFESGFDGDILPVIERAQLHDTDGRAFGRRLAGPLERTSGRASDLIQSSQTIKLSCCPRKKENGARVGAGLLLSHAIAGQSPVS
jgi:hypothetical protein